MNKLLSTYRCPSCWVEFPPEATRWIATSELGDAPRLDSTNLGENKSRHVRFLPERFTPNGEAIDSGSRPCTKLACPHCHLEFPRTYLESKSFMTSIVGGQATGKSYFLVSLIWWMQRQLPIFGLEFHATNAELNSQLDHLIERFFSNHPDNSKLVHIPFSIGGVNSVEVYLPRPHESAMPVFDDDAELMSEPSRLIKPFLYSFNRRPQSSDMAEQMYSLCLYDHAGEDYFYCIEMCCGVAPNGV